MGQQTHPVLTPYVEQGLAGIERDVLPVIQSIIYPVRLFCLYKPAVRATEELHLVSPEYPPAVVCLGFSAADLASHGADGQAGVTIRSACSSLVICSIRLGH